MSDQNIRPYGNRTSACSIIWKIGGAWDQTCDPWIGSLAPKPVPKSVEESKEDYECHPILLHFISCFKRCPSGVSEFERAEYAPVR